MVIIGQKFSAAFGRLRVETLGVLRESRFGFSAAFGRLRVETCSVRGGGKPNKSAAFGRLRVEIRVQVFRCV